MNNSSQPQISLDDLLTDTITITGYDSIDTIATSSNNSITYVSSPSYTYSPSISSMSGLTVGGTVSIPSLTTSQISTLSIDTSSFTFNIPEEWIGTFPAWDRVEDMCKKYPALEIALRNFKTVYQLVKDDYDNPTPKK